MTTNFYVSTNIPNSVLEITSKVRQKSILRLAGGMDNGREIYPFFRTALAGTSSSALMSGGTRVYNEKGKKFHSVCEVVADLSTRIPNLLTLGSFPRTGQITINSRSRIMVGEHTTINPATDHVICIQESADESKVLGWDGDLEAYFRFFSTLKHKYEFGTGIIVWNGGKVTIKEALTAKEFDHPVFIITGSGRAADNELSPEKFNGDKVHHISKDAPEKLRKLLLRYNLSK